MLAGAFLLTAPASGAAGVHAGLGPAPVRGAEDRVVLSGRLTVDGERFDAEFLGAVVLRPDGLISPCQLTLPEVDDGHYVIAVFGERETAGCGAKRTRIVLWTFVAETFLYTEQSKRWPGDGKDARFAGTFSTADPEGAVAPLTQMSGLVRGRDGRQLGGGTRVEAFIGTTRCALGSVRRSGDFPGYILAVVGPERIAGCTRGAPITFRINGRPAVETAVNDPARDMPLDLTVR